MIRGDTTHFPVCPNCGTPIERTDPVTHLTTRYGHPVEERVVYLTAKPCGFCEVREEALK